LTVTGAESLRHAGTFYILAVGVNTYANPAFNLNFAVADARAVAEELRRQQAQLGTFAKTQVVELLNQQATKQNLLFALARLAGTAQEPPPAGAPAELVKLEKAQPEDAVVIYFSGHGTAQQARFYLLPHDLGYTGPREKVDPAGLQELLAHGVSDEEINKMVEGVDAERLVLVIDACNSGQALEAEEKRRGPMNSKGLAQLAYEKGMYILAAAQGFQAAQEVEELGHGLLTFVLVEEGLKTRAADTAPMDDQVDVREWLDYATKRVPQLQEAKMDEAAKKGLTLRFVERGKRKEGVEHKESDDGTQRPRVFYRREAESHPLVVARVGTGHN